MNIPLHSRTLSLLTLSIVSSYLPFAQAEDYYFDPSLLEGSGIMMNLSKLNAAKDTPEPGDYQVDLYLNDKLITENATVQFRAAADGKRVATEPCLRQQDVDKFHLKSAIPVVKNPTDDCVLFSALSRHSPWDFEASTLKLKLQIPQVYLYQQPRGYVPLSEWDSGVAGLFIKHNTNYYQTKNEGGYMTKNLWSGLSSGTNIGLWQLRNQSNLTYSENSTSKMSKWRSVQSSAQRPLPFINSRLTLGDSYTYSSLFGSLSFTGVKLANDTRMIPQGRRGYAPEVRGVAKTTARVLIHQLGSKIFEATVPPGPYVIDDLNNTSGQGDLQVTVIEANGETSSFVVPYAAVPDSIRPGMWNYELALGKVRKYNSVNNNFLEGIIQRGISNTLTGNAGIRLAKDYEAYLLGGVIATQYGAIGVNATYSHAVAENQQRQSGWRAEGNYSKAFTSGTNLTLVAYRYSTQGFRDLQDVLGVRRYAHQPEGYFSDTLNQKNQFSATISQSFNEFGSLSLNASTSDYYGNKSRITQLQFGYSNNYEMLSYNINIGRQRTSYSTRNNYYDDQQYAENRNKYTENTVSIGFSMPLDWSKSRSSVSLNLLRNKTSESAITALSGSLGEKSNTSYSVYSGVERFNQERSAVSWGGSLHQNTSKGAFRGSYSQGSGYKQFGLGTSGTLLLHSGGVTYGPYASETFALVKAKGASGAEVKNGQGAVIDSFGYAIMPSMTPYRYNTISLDPKGLNPNIEIQGGSQKVVPYAGAVVRVEFETLTGQQTLINTRMRNNAIIPMGADVRGNQGQYVGMVGQSGQIYARISDRAGTLSVSWGNARHERCEIKYDLSASPQSDILQLDLPCEPVSGREKS